MELHSFSFLVLLSAFIYFCIQRVGKCRKLPPGPWGIPILGHLPILGNEPYKTLAQWQNIYGSIIYDRFGSFPAVVLNDASMIKEAFNQAVFSERPRIPLFEEASEGKGFAFTAEEKPEERAFLGRHLKAASRRSWELEEKIQEELAVLNEHFASYQGQPIPMHHQFTAPILNALSSLVLQQKIDYSSPKMAELGNGAKAFFECDGILPNLAMFIPWIAEFFRKASRVDKRVEGMRLVNKFVLERLDEEAESHTEGETISFKEAFMNHVELAKDIPNSAFHPSRGVPANFLSSMVRDFFLASLDTVSITMEFFTIYMALHPPIQKKLSEEIMGVIGGGRPPSLQDRPSCPYTQAVISETNRFATIAPLGDFHRVTETVLFHGYEIPKDTMIVSNLWAVHFSEGVWGDPQVFRPERFIQDDGQFRKSELVIPFSVGRRACMGETQAMDTIFLYVTSMVQRFEICCCGGNIPDPDINGIPGIVLNLKPFQLVLKDRFNKHGYRST